MPAKFCPRPTGSRMVKFSRPGGAVASSRKMMFSNSGHRPRTQQRMRLGATADGKLVDLDASLPHTADEIEAAMQAGKGATK